MTEQKRTREDVPVEEQDAPVSPSTEQDTEGHAFRVAGSPDEKDDEKSKPNDYIKV